MNQIDYTIKADKRAIGSVPWASQLINTEDVGDDIVKVMEKSGLDYSFHKEQLKLSDGRPVNNYAIVRDDTNEIISHSVGSDWTGVSNAKRFEWFSPYLQNADAKIIYAGAITDNLRTKVCVIARIEKNTNVEIQKGDDIAKYILLSDSFGGAALRPMLLSLRLMCMNGAMETTTSEISKIRHSSKITSRLDNVHNDIELWNKDFEEQVSNYRFLAGKDIKSNDNLNKYFMEVMDYEVNPEKGTLGTRQENTMVKLRELFHDTKHNKGNNLWTAYNAITAYVNHYMGREVNTALNSLFYGAGQTRQKRALEVAMDFASKI